MTTQTMLAEDKLIPYQAAALPPGPWLVFAPHPDDDIFGMGGAMALAAARGLEVEVVVLTGGDQAGEPAERRRENEAAAARLGLARLHFWELPDRELATAPLPAVLPELLARLAPRTVFLPGLQEYHPDHRAATLRLWPLLRQAGYTGPCWLYEISRHNEADRLLDITPVLAEKQAAMRCFASQLACRDYEGVIMAINRSRAYTLPPTVTHAEAFRVVEAGVQGLPELVLADCRRYWQGLGAPSRPPLVSLIVRTRNRPGYLQEALHSIAAQSYDPLEVVVVNDGGESVAEVVAAALAGRSYRLLELPVNRGRAAAANAGLRAAAGRLLGFLDDDDLLAPDHLRHLVAAIQRHNGRVAAYSAVQGMRRDDPKREVVATFNESEVSLAKLLLGNVLPIHSVLFPAALLDQGIAFDETLALYEDWDFWLQLARRVGFVFVDQFSAVYYLGGDSGVSPLAPDQAAVSKARDTLFDKWLRLLTPAELKAVADLYHATSVRLRASSDEVAGLQRQLAAGERQRAELAARREHELAELNRELQRLGEELARRDESLARRDEELTALNRRLPELASGLAAAREELAAREKNLAALSHQRDALLASTSWRLTRPLRWGGRFSRRLGGGVFYLLRAVYRRLPFSPNRRARLRAWYFTRFGRLTPSVPAAADVAFTGEENHAAPAAMAASRGRLLVVERSVPRPNQDAGSMMIFNFIKVFRRQGYAVTFFPMDLAYDPEYTEELRRLGVHCLHPPAVNSLEEHLAVAHDYDLILACRPDQTATLLPLLRACCPRARILYETHDLHYIREQRQAEVENDPRLREHARWRKEQELKIAAGVDCTLVVSEEERQALWRENPRLPVAVIPVVSEIAGSRTGFDQRRDLIFIGGFEHRPNVDAVLFFAREIFPLIRQRLPAVRWHVVGSKPPAEILALASEHIVVHGFVPELDELLGQVRISVNPLRFGAGLKGKIVTSLAHGVPCVGTTIAVEGMAAEPGRQLLVADRPAEFADAVVALYDNRELWEQLAAAGLEFVRRGFSLEVADAAFSKIIAELGACPRRLELELESFASPAAYRRADRAARLAPRLALEENLAAARRWHLPGFCAVCRQEVVFHGDLEHAFTAPDGAPIPNWRERLVCPRCLLNNRMRAVIHLFHLLVNPGRDSRLYLTEQTTPLFAWFRRHYPNAVGSEYLGEELAGGEEVRGLRHENLTRLSFADEEFDAILSFDVFEHIPDYRQALRECRRCLRPGGVLFFTVPFALEREAHLVRAEVGEDGQIRHRLPPEYHGDPVNAAGCLCFRHFGWDLLTELAELGFGEVAAFAYWSRYYGYLGGEQLLFRAVKKQDARGQI